MNTVRQDYKTDTVLNTKKHRLVFGLHLSKSSSFATDDLSSKPGLLVWIISDDIEKDTLF